VRKRERGRGRERAHHVTFIKYIAMIVHVIIISC
jgi:hypothetical protein